MAGPACRLLASVGRPRRGFPATEDSGAGSFCYDAFSGAREVGWTRERLARGVPVLDPGSRFGTPLWRVGGWPADAVAGERDVTASDAGRAAPGATSGAWGSGGAVVEGGSGPTGAWTELTDDLPALADADVAFGAAGGHAAALRRGARGAGPRLARRRRLAHARSPPACPRRPAPSPRAAARGT
jgi:hypothetical protein